MKFSFGSLTFCGAVLLGGGHPVGAETSAPSTLKVRSRIVDFLAGGELVRFGDVLSLSEDIRRVGDDYFTRSNLDIFDRNGHLVIQIPPTLKQSSTLDTIRGEGWSIEQGDQIKRITNLTVDEKEVRVKVQQVYKQEVIEISSSYPIQGDAYYDGEYYNLWDDIKKGVEKVGNAISNTFDAFIDQITKAGALVKELTEKMFKCADCTKWENTGKLCCTKEEKTELGKRLEEAEANLKGLEAQKPK